MVVIEADLCCNAKNRCRAHSSKKRRQAALRQEADQSAKSQQESIWICQAEVVHRALLSFLLFVRLDPCITDVS